MIVHFPCQYDLPLRKLAIPLMKFAERLRLY